MSDHYGLAEASKCTIESYPVTISKMLWNPSKIC